MKNQNKYILVLSLFVLSLVSCDQERLEPVSTVADGGGKLDTYMAYTIGTESETDMYGRIVFYLDDLGRTQVQVSVYNSTVGTMYPTAIMVGAIGDESTTSMALYDLEGKEASGLFYAELSDSKFYTITDTTFYDALPSLDAHINVYSGAGDIIAAGNIGANADPVETN